MTQLDARGQPCLRRRGPRRLDPGAGADRDLCVIVMPVDNDVTHASDLPLGAVGRSCPPGVRRLVRTLVPHLLEEPMPYTFDRIDPARTAMIVVDMQNDFVAEGAPLQSKQALAMADELAQTLTFCRQNGIRVIYTAHVHREDGSDMGMYDD